METAWIAMGSNLGDRGANLLEAADRVAGLAGVDALARGPLRETAALVRPGAPAQRAYLNAVARVGTRLDPPGLLRALQRIEHAMGRPPAEAREVWAPRTVDLDLLFHGRSAGRWPEPALELPHPRWGERAFVLLPMLDVDPGFIGPGGAACAEKLQLLLGVEASADPRAESQQDLEPLPARRGFPAASP